MKCNPIFVIYQLQLTPLFRGGDGSGITAEFLLNFPMTVAIFAHSHFQACVASASVGFFARSKHPFLIWPRENKDKGNKMGGEGRRKKTIFAPTNRKVDPHQFYASTVTISSVKIKNLI